VSRWGVEIEVGGFPWLPIVAGAAMAIAWRLLS
jgi:hypothetical protein